MAALGLLSLLHLSGPRNRPPGDGRPGGVAPATTEPDGERAGAPALRMAGRTSVARKRDEVGHRAWRPSGW